MSRKEQIKQAEAAVAQAERGGNFDTVHHERLSKLTKPSKEIIKEKNDA